MKKKFLSLVLALMMLLSLVACGGNNNPPAEPTPDTPPVDDPATPDDTQTPDEPAEAVNYKDLTREDVDIYDEVFGEFYEAYMAAKEEQNVPMRYAKMAIAEAKMLEGAVMVPKNSLGGGYAISRSVPYTVSPCLWGMDEYRWEKRLVTNELIRSEDIAALQAMYGELKVSAPGTYYTEAQKYLADKGYTLKDSYTESARFNDDLTTWDILSTSLQANSEFICKTISGLLQYDNENIPQPNLATEWTESDDHLVYTFKLRQDVVWTDSQGREVGKLTADDFVAGFQHMLDTMGGLEVLVDGVIVGVHEYINQEDTDFNNVGVKALDEYTVEYTLTKPTSYFLTILNYGLFCPMNRSYYESQGGKFGEEFDSAAADYNYGKTPDTIAYCGPYLVTNYTSKTILSYKANPTYWDADNVTIKSITHLYDDGSDPTRSLRDCLAGSIDGTGVGTSALEIAKQEKAPIDGEDITVFDAYHYQSSTNATSYMGFFNLNRKAFANYNDATKAVSSQTEEDAARTHAAMMNPHFRMALLAGYDRGAYQEQRVGEELKYAALINTYTPGDFVSLGEDVTIDINGTATTSPAGTNYGVIVQAQIDADGLPIKVYDPEGNGGAGSSSGFDGWYNKSFADSEMAIAIEELAAQGLEISKENPIQIDVTFAGNVESFVNCANVTKQCWEAIGGGVIQVNLIACADMPEWYDSGYFPETGAEMNFDYTDTSGWGPDYGDPSSYLDTLQPNGEGYMAKSFGLFWA